MRRPFVVRVLNDDADVAAPIARAISALLDARGARASVHTARRGLPGTTVVLGVASEDEAPRWLAPLAVPDDPAAASAEIERFLGSWGFIVAREPATRRASES